MIGWGDNKDGQLGQGHCNSPVNKIVKIPLSGSVIQFEVGAHHVIVLVEQPSIEILICKFNNKQYRNIQTNSIYIREFSI